MAVGRLSQVGQGVAASSAAGTANTAVMAILFSVSLGHMLNDMMQSALTSIYPLVKDPLALDFVHIGIITLVFQLTASILQPIVGWTTDRHPRPFSLPVGMAATFCGMGVLAFAGGFWTMLLAASLIGVGSSIFHPEASRVARLASGGRYGFAQSFFQVGGNTGQAIGPLLVALLVIPNGQLHVIWFALFAVIGMVVLGRVGVWYRDHLGSRPKKAASAASVPPMFSRARIGICIAILLVMTFSKNFYMAAFSSYYTFFLMERFAISVQSAQIHLFVFLGAVALGTFIGGPVGDRIGRKPVMWASMFGVLPLSVALPFLPLFWVDVTAIIVGMLMASAFPAIVVYAQELLPGRVGMIAGLFFGFAFGMAGIGAAVIGWLADVSSLAFAFKLAGWLPLLGIFVIFLPDLERRSVPA